jgi:hypothetical protein
MLPHLASDHVVSMKLSFRGNPVAVEREHGIWQGDSTPAGEHSHLLVAISLSG